MARPLPIAACLAALAAALAGCGGDDDPGRTATVPAGQELRVVGDEYSFDPETIVVEGARGPTGVTIELVNEGSLAHNLRVFRDGDEVGGTPTFQGGESRRASLRLQPGSYELICTVGNHEELGMTGKLELR